MSVDDAPTPPQIGRASEAIHAVSRLLARAVESAGPDAVRSGLVREARDARLVQTVADQVGSALRSATLYERRSRSATGPSGPAAPSSPAS